MSMLSSGVGSRACDLSLVSRCQVVVAFACIPDASNTSLLSNRGERDAASGRGGGSDREHFARRFVTRSPTCRAWKAYIFRAGDGRQSGLSDRADAVRNLVSACPEERVPDISTRCQLTFARHRAPGTGETPPGERGARQLRRHRSSSLATGTITMSSGSSSTQRCSLCSRSPSTTTTQRSS